MNPEVKTEVISSGPDLTIIGLFFQADPFVKGVMFLLIFASIWCWAIIINKSNTIRREKKNSLEFEDIFWSGVNLDDLFQEYSKKNLALVLIEDNKNDTGKVYIKAIIQGKNISKSLNFKKQKFNTSNFYEKIIKDSKKELVNLVKSKNLIDIRIPSFLNVKLNLNKKSNLEKLRSRIKKIDSIENVYVQQFNMNYMNLKIKYLGKLDKIINLLKKENIDLQLVNDQWIIKAL